jgi:hypothetical protein
MKEKTRLYILAGLLVLSLALLWYAATMANRVTIGS